MSAIFGERLIFGQHAGPDIELIVFGDEFYARYETINGYTVVYDLNKGYYCFADLNEGRFISTGISVSQPPPDGLRKHLRESFIVRNDRFDERYNIIRPYEPLLSASSNFMLAVGPNSGLLEGRQVSHGKVRGLTILVEFEDLKSDVTRDDVEALLNDLDYADNGNFCSVRKYYKLMSKNKLDFTNKVVGPIKLSRRQSYYINELLVQEALEKAISDHNLDLSEFDSRGEGYVDSLSFMYAGRTLYQGNLWPHNSIINLTDGTYRTHFYTIQSLGRNKVDLSIGTFTHEAGHMLCRFPDLYDYGKRDGDFEESSGLGQYCLMSWGNHNDYGKTPSPICTYLRDLAGWCDDAVILNDGGKFTAKHGEYGKMFKYRTDKPNEYYLIENRTQKNLDEYLPDTGLAVYHCDTRGSNEHQDGTPENHYQCALIQADGHFDLETTVDGGDDGDFYEDRPGIALSDETMPNSNRWDGSASGMVVADIGSSGDTIDFKIGAVSDEKIISRQVVADMIIPDDNKDGATSTVSVDQSGKVKKISVTVKISHTYKGDLDVRLYAPSGKEAILHKVKLDPMDNLELDLNSDDFDALAGMVGEKTAGEWKLKVCDLWQDDVGRLDYWDLTVEL